MVAGSLQDAAMLRDVRVFRQLLDAAVGHDVVVLVLR